MAEHNTREIGVPSEKTLDIYVRRTLFAKSTLFYEENIQFLKHKASISIISNRLDGTLVLISWNLKFSSHQGKKQKLFRIFETTFFLTVLLRKRKMTSNN